MNHSPAYILAQYLVGEGDLSDPTGSGSWPVFVGALPDGDDIPDNAVAAIDTSPMKDGRVMGGVPLFHYGFQLLLRSDEYNAGYDKASALAVVLSAVDRDQEVVSGDTYRLDNVTQISGVIPLGQEQGTKRRWLFSVNFLATLQEV